MWLRTPSPTSTTYVCLNYDENMYLSDMCGFSRIEQRPIQAILHRHLDLSVCHYFLGDTSRYVCTSISWRIRMKLFERKFPELTEQCWRPTYYLCYTLYIYIYIYIYIYHHNHHHVAPPARISLTLSRHFSLSFIASGRSSGLHPVSSHSCCM